MGMDSMLRSAVLTAAGNRTVRTLFEKYGMKLGVSRFVAAEHLEGALDAVRSLNDQGLLVTLDYLGESVQVREEAVEAAGAAALALRRIAELQLKANVSVKLTQLGLNIDPKFCSEQLASILDEAERTNNFVRIDMEDSSVTQLTLDLFESLLARYGKERVGTVLQSYLYRTEADRKRLGAKGANLRIVKGAYREPKHIAYPKKSDVDAAYIKLVRQHMLDGAYTAVATHDERIIEDVIRFVRENGIGSDRFEFQMLYGIASSLQLRLAREGWRVRVYAPYGKAWYPYFTRRIAERPANLWFVARGLLRK